VKITDQQPWRQKLEEAGLVIVQFGKAGRRVKFRLAEEEAKQHRQLLKELFLASYTEYKE